MAEPEWDDATRELALALDGVEMCPVCGWPAYLCQDPALQDDWRAGDPIRCHAQTARLMRQKHVTEETNPGVGALIWPVQLTRRTGG
jgi:hypothetical protein